MWGSLGYILRDVPLGLLRDMPGLVTMLATVTDAAMPHAPSVGDELPATGTSADPPVFTFGRFGPKHSDPSRLDRSADHRGISWAIHGHAPVRRILVSASGEEEGEGRARRRQRGERIEVEQAYRKTHCSSVC